jgi:prepilin-type N-terminal cleavage/methylation domain-containing protein
MFQKLRKRVVRDERGFTLIELLIVMVILAILTAVAAPTYLALKNRAKDAAAKADLSAVVPSIEQYFSDNNTYVGMTLAGLQTSYDPSLKTGNFLLPSADLTASTYCIQTNTAGPDALTLWRKNGPSADYQSQVCA